MLIQLLNAILRSMLFKEIDPSGITRIDSNVGYTWFKFDGQTYCISIQEADFDLDNHAGSNQQE